MCRSAAQKRLACLALRGKHRGIDDSRRYDVDAPRRQFPGNAAHEGLHGAADGTDGRESRSRTPGGKPADQHDRAVLAHVLRAESNRVRIAPELAERALEAVQVHLQKRTDRALAAGCRIDKNVERCIGRKHLGKPTPVKHVRLPEAHRLRRRAPGGLDIVGAPPECSDDRPAFGQANDRRQPDPRRPAEDERPFSIDVHAAFS